MCGMSRRIKYLALRLLKPTTSTNPGILHMAACTMHLSLLLNKNCFAKDIRIKAKVLSNLIIETNEVINLGLATHTA